MGKVRVVFLPLYVIDEKNFWNEPKNPWLKKDNLILEPDDEIPTEDFEDNQLGVMRPKEMFAGCFTPKIVAKRLCQAAAMGSKEGGVTLEHLNQLVHQQKLRRSSYSHVYAI